MPDIPEHPDSDLVVRVATTGTVYPYSYFGEGGVTDFDIELARRFCDWLGVRLELTILDWHALDARLATGVADVAMSNLQLIEEAKEVMDFSDVLYEERLGIMVRDTGATGGVEGLVGVVMRGLERTLVREGRWRLFASGMGVTALITVVSCLAGTVLGCILHVLEASGGRLRVRVVDALVWLVQGMPVVVLLLGLYYVVFARLNVSGIVVSCVAFSLTVAVSVLKMVDVGIDAVDAGEREAALALGYNERQTFSRVVLPQTVRHVLPLWHAEVISTLKASAVVGYIAVQDLTKAGDIVRGRTYDALFPLLAVTLGYFALEALVNLLMRVLQRRCDPKARSAESVLKGVDLDRG